MEHRDFKTAGEALEISEEISILTAGCSMQPMLRQHRDLVIVKRIDRALKKGDVVLYPGNDGKFILHRIIAVKNGSYIMRGDNNYFTEHDINPDSIVGILKEFYRDGKYIHCETDKKYQLYTFYILHSYFPRYFWKRLLKPMLSKIKHRVIK
ncbi:MAG: S24/S26 family peptidase [Clostridia bacterium]|nr:S24/S26 family peptidase [Clostridia bacterium]